MADNLRSFEMALDAFVDEDIPGGVHELRNAVALEVLTGVVMLTPVDIGRLRGNWQVTTGGPVSDFDWEAVDALGTRTIAEASQALEAMVDAYGLIWVGNGLPYAGYVNDGTALVPAVHMVEQTVERVDRRFRK